MDDFHKTTGTYDADEVLPAGEPHLQFPILLGLEGPLKGRRFILDKQVVSIGRDMLADIVIKDSKASRHHTRIIYTNIQEKHEIPACRVFDAGSTNGTFVNGKRVDSGGVPLADRDRILVGRTLFAFFIRDDQEVAPEEVFEILGTQDEATGLINPKVFHRILSREMERAHRYGRDLAFVLLRVDNLKQTAEEGGAAFKNTVLRRIGFLLTQSLRRQDIAGRIGPSDSDLAILLPETDPDSALRVCERLCERVAAETFSRPDDQIRVTASIGLAALRREVEKADALLREAESALERAGAQGGNKAVLYQPGASV